MGLSDRDQPGQHSPLEAPFGRVQKEGWGFMVLADIPAVIASQDGLKMA